MPVCFKHYPYMRKSYQRVHKPSVGALGQQQAWAVGWGLHFFGPLHCLGQFKFIFASNFWFGYVTAIPLWRMPFVAFRAQAL